MKESKYKEARIERERERQEEKGNPLLVPSVATKVRSAGSQAGRHNNNSDTRGRPTD